MKKVAVIGGGITGLSAAFTLHQAKQQGMDIDYILIEKNPKLGGKIKTDNIDGFVIEAGPDCFVAEKPAAFQLTSQIGIEDRLMPSNESTAGTFIYSGGKLQKLPDGLMLLVPNKIWPFVTSPLISWPGKVRMAFDLVIPKKKDTDDETLAGFVSRRMGQEVLDKIAEPMIGGIHGGDPDTMSLKASFPRFMKMEEDYGNLTFAMLASRRKMAQAKAKAKANPNPSGKPKRTFFMSYKEGMIELVDGVEAKLDKSKILLGHEVTKIEKKTNGTKTTYLIHINKLSPIEVDAVILTVPADNASTIFKNIDSKISENLATIPMSSSASISMAYKKSDIPAKLEGFGFVIPYVEGRKINAVTYTSLKWNNRVPKGDYILIRSFVGKPKNQAPALLSEQQIETLVKEELSNILGITAEPLVTKVHKWEKARPQYILGHLDRINEVDDKLKSNHPGLFLAGASYHGIGVPDCITDGTKTANEAITYLK